MRIYILFYEHGVEIFVKLILAVEKLISVKLKGLREI